MQIHITNNGAEKKRVGEKGERIENYHAWRCFVAAVSFIYLRHEERAHEAASPDRRIH